VRGLEARFFGDTGYDLDGGDKSDSASHRTTSQRDLISPKMSPRGDMHDGMAFKEDNFLTSANLCRWILDFNEVLLGKQVSASVLREHLSALEIELMRESCGV
jgi:hypothetical protein